MTVYNFYVDIAHLIDEVLFTRGIRENSRLNLARRATANVAQNSEIGYGTDRRWINTTDDDLPPVYDPGDTIQIFIQDAKGRRFLLWKTMD